jgi:hypothetical protein
MLRFVLRFHVNVCCAVFKILHVNDRSPVSLRTGGADRRHHEVIEPAGIGGTWLG